jgi:hypothetical protein
MGLDFLCLARSELVFSACTSLTSTTLSQLLYTMFVDITFNKPSASALVAVLLAASPFHAQAATVSATPAQTFLGIGGSGAWWPHDLFNFPDAVRQNLSTLLFSQSGLGLSNYRFNIGGGGVAVTNPVRAPQTFYVSPGVYNFSADPQGVYFMQQAAAHGVPSITAFVNSAPAQLTSNHASCGGTFVNGAAYFCLSINGSRLSFEPQAPERHTGPMWPTSSPIGDPRVL